MTFRSDQIAAHKTRRAESDLLSAERRLRKRGAADQRKVAQQICLVMPLEVLTRVDAYAKRLSLITESHVSRSEAFRVLIDRAFAQGLDR